MPKKTISVEIGSNIQKNFVTKPVPLLNYSAEPLRKPIAKWNENTNKKKE